MLKLNTSFLIATCCFSSPLVLAQTTNTYAYDELGRVVTATDTTNGARNFTYDAAGNRTCVTTGANRSPTVVGESMRIRPFVATYLNVLSNDSDPDCDVISISSFTSCGVANVTRSGNGLSVVGTYAPSSCSFTYTVSDGKGGLSTATVSVTTY